MQPLKNVLGRLMFASGLDALLLGRTGVVVAFHRVHEDRDVYGLSIDRRTFQQYCEFFQRHFKVIPLGEFVAKLERGEPLNRHLAITFDDGYRDNFDNAVPVLEKLALPATFFVVTQWIGSNVVPWWDAHGTRSWMTWDQVRELRRRGFEIGSHTLWHANLSKYPEKIVRQSPGHFTVDGSYVLQAYPIQVGPSLPGYPGPGPPGLP